MESLIGWSELTDQSSSSFTNWDSVRPLKSAATATTVAQLTRKKQKHMECVMNATATSQRRIVEDLLIQSGLRPGASPSVCAVGYMHLLHRKASMYRADHSCLVRPYVRKSSASASASAVLSISACLLFLAACSRANAPMRAVVEHACRLAGR